MWERMQEFLILSFAMATGVFFGLLSWYVFLFFFNLILARYTGTLVTG